MSTPILRFDEKINHAEKLQGFNASFIVSRGEGPNTYLEPFWIHTENPAFRVAGRAGVDDRNTVGARLWGRFGSARFDWTVARQTGRTVDDRPIDAWGIFAVQSLVLSETGWKPRVTSRIDVASGGGAYSGGFVRDFNPLYASSNYLSEGRFLSLSNLLMVVPGIEVTPTARTTLSLEYGYAQRLDRNDAVYAGGRTATFRNLQILRRLEMDPKVRKVRPSTHPSVRSVRSGGAEVAESSHPGARCHGETLLLTITEIAARVGAEVSLIEYLQRKGILGTQQEPGVYPEEALWRVRWALAGNSLGLDLLQVRAFIELCSHGNKEAFDEYLKDRIDEVDLRLKELRTTRAALEALSYDHPAAIKSAAGAAQSVKAQPSWRSV